jgi:predicted AAA+ superfamily ATPase
MPDARVFDLLDASVCNPLRAHPERLSQWIPKDLKQTVVLDEVQRVPALLDEVHRLIEGRGLRFVLTGSSARKLRRGGVNLLAGRALRASMHPLTVAELGADFDLERSLRFGHLPMAVTSPDPGSYLHAYVQTYLREEVLHEGLTRDLAAFARFLEAASFSQGAPLNISTVAREAGVQRKVVEGYFSIVEDLLLGTRLPVFTRRARRRMTAHPKFYFFDVGVFRTLRPTGPLDRREEIEGAALETLVFQELTALNDYLGLGYSLHFWRTADGAEVDFVLYGERGLIAIEVKRSRGLRGSDLRGLRAFKRDFPEARTFLLCGEPRASQVDGIEVLPISEGLRRLRTLL